MNIEDLRTKIKSTLVSNLEGAILEIKEATHFNSQYFNEIVQLHARWNSLIKEKRKELIDHKDYSIGENKIRDSILEVIDKLQVSDLKSHSAKNSANPISSSVNKLKQANNTFEPIDYGVSKNGKGEFKLTDAPTVFFQYRFEKAFPGVRGLKWFESENAVKRLALLLKKPTRFDIADGHGLYSDPIWWFRGSSGLPVDKFEILSGNRCLLDFKELKVKRIAAYNSSFYYKSFVYVEAEPDSPTGLYDYPEGYISDRINSSGYLREEYGLYKGRPISRAEYDDGAAEIDDDIVNFFGEAEFRARYLTRYNFILVAKTSPFNSREGEILGDEYMDAILQGTKTVEDFAEMADELPKNYMDY